MTRGRRWLLLALAEGCTPYTGATPRDAGIDASPRDAGIDAPPRSPIGGPCRVEGDCADGVCVTHIGALTVEGGYCTRGCTPGLPCGVGARCEFINLQSGTVGSCLRACDGDCRPGQACTVLFSGVPVCLPLVPRPPADGGAARDGGGIGAACEGGSECAEGFHCEARPGGHCALPCPLEWLPCEGEGVCLEVASAGPPSRACRRPCRLGCRDGYFCRGPESFGGCVPR